MNHQLHYMRNILPTILFLLSISPIFAQENIKEYVIKNHTPINSIHPDSSDYSDLEAIGNAIGDSRVVMLGEQSHGDAPTFLAKTRLIKYLHEKKGFNVLAFEADYYALSNGWELLQNKQIVIDSFPAFLKMNIHDEWTLCNACNNLFKEYIPQAAKTNSPLIIAGVDNQPVGAYSRTYLAGNLDHFLTSQNIPFVQSKEYKSVFIPFMNQFLSHNYPADSAIYIYRMLLKNMNTITQQLPESTYRNTFWGLTIQGIQTHIEQSLSYRLHKNSNQVLTTRDAQMAKNLEWLVRTKYPNEKIIVWAANVHIIKNTWIPYKDNSMGGFFTEDSLLRNKTYVLGFATRQGTAGTVISPYKPYPVKQTKKNSFEHWMPDDVQHAFVDFKWFNRLYPQSRKRFNMQGMGHVNKKLKWAEGFDGVFYIRDTYSCVGLK